jgi:hypothetical protein
VFCFIYFEFKFNLISINDFNRYKNELIFYLKKSLIKNRKLCKVLLNSHCFICNWCSLNEKLIGHSALKTKYHEKAIVCYRSRAN